MASDFQTALRDGDLPGLRACAKADQRDHPIRRLHDAGVRVSVNTDDALIFGTSLSEEFLALFQAGTLGAAELDEIRLSALQ